MQRDYFRIGALREISRGDGRGLTPRRSVVREQNSLKTPWAMATSGVEQHDPLRVAGKH
jgi:hypothetical protein